MAASPNATTTPLKDLANTGNLASILKDNSGSLDTYTGQYVNEKTQGQLQGDLDKINVVMGVDKNATLKILGQLGISAGNNPDALTVGNTILVFGTMKTDGNGKVLDQGDANLLGHEVIHALQALESGSISGFVNSYMSASMSSAKNGRDSYYGNLYEIAAYNFGPHNVSAQKAGSLVPPIFNNYGGWHK